MSSTDGIPYLGSRISIVSKSEIRYEGILYTVDTKQSTIALAKVKCLGTEGRSVERQVEKRDETYEYIIFKAADIKDLTVCETPKPVPQLYGNLPYDPAILQASQLNENGHHHVERATATTGAAFFNGFGHLSPPQAFPHATVIPQRTRSSLSFGSVSGQDDINSTASAAAAQLASVASTVPAVVDTGVQAGPGGTRYEAGRFGGDSPAFYSPGVGAGGSRSRLIGHPATDSPAVPGGAFRRPLLGSPVGGRGQGPVGGGGRGQGPLCGRGGPAPNSDGRIGASTMNRPRNQHHVSFSLDENSDSPQDSRLNRSVGSLEGPRLERFSGRGVAFAGRSSYGALRGRGNFRGNFNRNSSGAYVNASFDSALAPQDRDGFSLGQFGRQNHFNRSFDAGSYDRFLPQQNHVFRDRFNGGPRGRGFYGPGRGSNFVQPRFRRANASDSADGKPVMGKSPELKFETDYDFEEANASFVAKMHVADGKETPPSNSQDEGIDKKTEEDNEVARTEELAAASTSDDNLEVGDGERSVTPKSTTPQPSDSGNESTSMPSPPLDVHYGSKYYNKELSFYDRISCETMEKINANNYQNVNRRCQQDLNKETFGVAYARQMMPGGSTRGTAGMRVYGRGRGYGGQGRGNALYPSFVPFHNPWTIPPFHAEHYGPPFPSAYHPGAGFLRGGRGLNSGFRGRWINNRPTFVM